VTVMTSMEGIAAFNSSNATIPHHELSALEAQWLWLYSLHSNPILVTAAIAFILHEVVFFGGWIPFMICDYIPSLQKYKLQPDKSISRQQLWKCIRGVLFQHYFIQSPLVLAFHPTGEMFGLRILEVPFPSWWQIAWQVAFCAVFEDTYHYWFHRALHWGPLYKHIHKQHHEYSAPFGLAAEYAHPLETLILGMGTITPMLLLAYLTHNIHMVSVLTWMSFRVLQTIEAHCGYEFPIGFKNLIPFWSGADHHDYHHQAFVGCYSTSFRWWDFWMGTDVKYHAFRHRQQEEKKSLKTH